jgi:hypothetical protein
VDPLRRSDYVPPLLGRDAQRLRALPPSWEQRVDESAVGAMIERAEAAVSALGRLGRRREADQLRRGAQLLRRADELYGHAADVEVLVGLYRALALFAEEPLPSDARAWVQAGMQDEPVHGPAFRETAALRNRAFRAVARELARCAREGFSGYPPRRP